MNGIQLFRAIDLGFHIGLPLYLFFASALGVVDQSLVALESPLRSLLDIFMLAIARMRFNDSRLLLASTLIAELKFVGRLLLIDSFEDDPSYLNDFTVSCGISFVICISRFLVDRSDQVPDISWTSLFRFANGHWRRLLVGIAVLLFRLPFSLAVPHYVSEGIGSLIEKNYERFEYACISLFVAGTLDAVLDFWCVYIFATAQQEIIFSIRSSLFKSILFHPLKFFDVTATGELQSRLNADTAEMANDLSWVFRFSIEAGVRISGVLGYMFFASWRLALLVVLLVPMNAVINTFFGHWMTTNQKMAQDLLAVSNTVANESFGSVQTVKSFRGEKRVIKKYVDSLELYKALQYKAAIVSSTYYMLVSTFLMNTVIQTAIVGYGGFLAWHSLMQTERLISFMLYNGQLQNYTSQLLNTYVNLVKCAGVSDKVFALMNPETLEDSDDEPIRRDRHGKSDPPSIEFSNVTFYYTNRPEIPVLNHVSFQIPAGACTAIVGHSGSGKSSLLSLLLRLYPFQTGKILIGGVSLETIPLKALRGRFLSVVSQEPVLFRGTIRENVLYSLPNEIQESASEHLVRRALSIACIMDFVESLPEKLDTKLGDRGVTLSGGQKQRIAIARAIISDPPVLLLDEAMSALDPESEGSVQKALDSAMVSRTTVMVSHRISTVLESASNCIVMQKGKVVEEGPPKDLVQTPGGPFRLLYEIQQRNIN